MRPNLFQPKPTQPMSVTGPDSLVAKRHYGTLCAGQFIACLQNNYHQMTYYTI